MEKHRANSTQKLAYYSFSLYTREGSAGAIEAASAPFDGKVPDAAFLVAGASTPKLVVDMTEEDMGYIYGLLDMMEYPKGFMKRNLRWYPDINETVSSLLLAHAGGRMLITPQR